MHWQGALSYSDFLFIGLFFLLYLLYVARTIRIAGRLRTTARSVVLKFFLRSAYFTLFLVALLGPSFGGSRKELKAIGKDIYLAVDLSKSMDATDVQPSRLNKMKFELQNLVDAFQSNRIGLIIFSSEAFMQCPLTFDQTAISLFIQTLTTQLVPEGGTDFGPPLRMALDRINSENSSVAQRKSKVVILVSDGEDFGDETQDIIKELEDNDIRLFTVGIGTEDGGKIPAGNSFKKDREGNLVTTKLNRESMQKLAKQANGNYYEINDKTSEVGNLIKTINAMEGNITDKRMIDVMTNRYYYFLLAALILVALDSLVTVRTMRI